MTVYAVNIYGLSTFDILYYFQSQNDLKYEVNDGVELVVIQ